MSYLFGDSDLAAQRLGLVASTFRPVSEEFLVEMVIPDKEPPELAIDLGCGPGHSTRMISETVKASRTLGLDTSEHFISMAKDSASQGVAFAVHDFTQTPFPEGPADLLYSRFELTHFGDWKTLISSWSTQLRANGLLILEEVEWIRTGEPAFSIYLGMLESLMHSQSLDLYIGPRLEQMGQPPGLQKTESRVRRVPAPLRKAAMMFLMNLWAWREEPFIQESYPPDFIEQIEMGLQELTEDPADLIAGEEFSDLSPEAGIEWGMRQVAFRKIGD